MKWKIEKKTLDHDEHTIKIMSENDPRAKFKAITRNAIEQHKVDKKNK